MRVHAVWFVLAFAACAGEVAPGRAPANEGPGRPPETTPGPRPPAGSAGPAPSAASTAPPPPSPLQPGSSAPAATPTCTGAAAGPAPLRRLTRIEYDNTIADLLGDRTARARAFDPDTLVGPFESNAFAPATELAVDQYREAAEAAATANAARAWRDAGCADATCAPRFITAFGRRAFRRSLDAAERARYEAMFEEARKARGVDAAARLVVQTFLQSPSFLYHVETWGARDPASGVARLDPYAIASRLSYFLWRSMPDAELLAAAEDGRLATPAGVEAQARRLLASPRAQTTLVDFHLQWLGLRDLARVEIDQKAYPVWSDRLRAAMQKETEEFVAHVLTKRAGSLDDLLMAPLTILNADVAPLYGVTGAAGTAVSLDPRRRAGLLTQPSVLTVTHGPILRGKLLRTRVLCQEVPPPPPGVNTTLPPPAPNQSPRARLIAHSARPECAFCHKLMDPLGFAFDHFDDVGRWRDTYQGFPVDATGELELGARTVAFDGAVDLAGKVAVSDEARACVARQWLRFALGRNDAAADECAVQKVMRAFRDSAWDVRALVAAVATSEALSNVAVPAP